MGSDVKETRKAIQSETLKDQPKKNLQLLLDTFAGINRTMELKNLLNQSMEATRIVMNSEASSLLLKDQDTGELYVSLPTGPVKDTIRGKSIPPNKGIGGWVAENKQPYLTNDVENSEFFYGDLAEDFKTRNIVCVPLINNHDEVIGVLQALNRREGKDFTPHDVPVFQALASHVSTAIERARQVEELHSQVKEKEVMLTEIHHRIKNNLAAIAGLIEMELPQVDDERSQQVLKSTHSRIHSMIEVHDLLCQRGLFKDVELGLYLRQLAEKVQKTMSDDPDRISIRLNSESMRLKADKALLCGLIMNELLVNIYKHAFVGMDKGEIILDLTHDNENIKLTITDNGIGLSSDFKASKKESIGMWIVEVLLKKLDGSIDTIGQDGTQIVITFPKE